MFDISQDIQSLTDFKRNTADFMKQLKKHHRAVVLTVNGKAELVIQDANSYQKLLDLADRADTIATLKERLAQAKRGDLISVEEFDKRMHKKYGIPR